MLYWDILDADRSPKCRFSTKFSKSFDHHGETKKEMLKDGKKLFRKMKKKPEWPRTFARIIYEYQQAQSGTYIFGQHVLIRFSSDPI